MKRLSWFKLEPIAVAIAIPIPMPRTNQKVNNICRYLGIGIGIAIAIGLCCPRYVSVVLIKFGTTPGVSRKLLCGCNKFREVRA